MYTYTNSQEADEAEAAAQAAIKANARRARKRLEEEAGLRVRRAERRLSYVAATPRTPPLIQSRRRDADDASDTVAATPRRL